ncbi:MAG: RNA-binding S4 domain-containing protein [Hyphomicrobiales bacterium]|nr:MAG: RNA-binding S4 domain-containing protein [Hyphomicrobiales bacterium]
MREEDEDDDDNEAGPGAGQRLDKWLWYARILKSRTLAAEAVAAGRIRVNRVRVAKPAYAVKPGDVVTVALRGKVHVLRILTTGERRGPPSEARTLYEDVSAAASVDKLTDAGK